MPHWERRSRYVKAKVVCTSPSRTGHRNPSFHIRTVMLSLTGKKRRAGGACAPCTRKKRKCDHAEPRCSQCIRHNDSCEKRTFKHWQGSNNRRARHSQNSHFRDHQTSTLTLLQEPDPVDESSPHAHQSESEEHVTTESFEGVFDVSDWAWVLTPPSCEPEDNRPGISVQVAETLELIQDALQAEDASVEEIRRPEYEVHDVSLLQPSTLRLMELAVWPDDLAQSSLERLLWHHFLFLSDDRLLCFDLENVTHEIHFQNPFFTIIPRMALSSAPLRAAILCFSATIYKSQNPNASPRIIPEHFLQRAIQSLIRLATDTTDIEDLLTVTATGIFLYLCDVRSSHNLLELSRSAAAYLADRVSNTTFSSEPAYQTVMSLLRWADISTLCSLRPWDRCLKEETHQMIEMREHELQQNFSVDFGNWISHPIFAFSVHLVNPLLRLGRIIQLQSCRTQTPQSEEEHHNEEMDKRIASLEEDILNATDMFQDSQGVGTGDPTALLSLNRAMHDAALLLFYTRLRCLPFTAPLIRHYVEQIVEQILLIKLDSHASNAVLFPLVVAGCEAVDLIARKAIKDRIQQHNGIVSTERHILALHRIWTLRDADPGLRWPEWTKQINSDLGDLILF
ncbi:fungal-specific transcription factor domain-containing protein [Pyrenochaeta sp. MPI-SDFR-AT-0127]|nr:fungal-specific transcription factor domain-containing protein [Pyrenochaeta sp. MPI-SDFR-AT-0127]